nr:hypothetical protein [Citrobacter koseri]
MKTAVRPEQLIQRIERAGIHPDKVVKTAGRANLNVQLAGKQLRRQCQPEPLRSLV